MYGYVALTIFYVTCTLELLLGCKNPQQITCLVKNCSQIRYSTESEPMIIYKFGRTRIIQRSEL